MRNVPRCERAKCAASLAFLQAQLAALPGGGRFDCVLDSLGGKYFTAGLEALHSIA
jgi:hypothetical protein